MSQTFNSKNKPVWLKKSHQMRSSRSLEIGKQSIDNLLEYFAYFSNQES
jgi:hypothetical protein